MGWARLGIVGVVIIAGIVAYFARADRDGGGAIVEAGTVAASDMRVGDCFDMPDAQEFDEVRGVPCGDPHDVELFHLLDLSEWTAYPTDEQWVRQVADKCLPAFEAYVGMAYDTAEHLDIDWVVPTEAAWDNGDRAAACLLFRIDGTKLEASLRLG